MGEIVLRVGSCMQKHARDKLTHPTSVDRTPEIRADIRRQDTMSLRATFLLASVVAISAEYLAAFEHGIASGDPHSDSIVLWTRLSLIHI